MYSHSTSRTALPLLLVGGLATGLVNGLLGAGGGIVAVFVLVKVLGPALTDRRDVFANALAIILPLSVISVISYTIGGSMPSGELNLLVLPAVIGGLLGGILLDRIDPLWIQLIFSAIVLYSGIAMLF
jgi:uncharacterized membrane protein YfcA